MERIWFNGESATLAEATDLCGALFSESSIVTNGGYLFRCAYFGAGGFALSLCPSFSEGERMYHYNLPLPDGSFPELLGTITAGPTVSLLFKETDMTDAKRAAYRELYADLAAALLPCFPAEPKLDWATGAIVAAGGILSTPCETLSDLVRVG